jgi:hypothetical protein
MKFRMCGLLALGLSALTVNACLLSIRVACPNDRSRAGIVVCVAGVGCAPTDSLGVAEITVPGFGDYTVCVDESTLPTGANLQKPCKEIKVTSDAPPLIEFELRGEFCETPPPPGPCWLTGGGTIGKTQGQPNYSFGGVVYPGCSPKAAEGGNWNVVDHFTGLHFQGQQIIVDSCSGVPTRSPKVTVNVINFHGTGRVMPDGASTEDDAVSVTFEGQATDNAESGGGTDKLYLQVKVDGTVVMQIGTAADPATISTGNLQIHQSSCNN